MNARAQQKIIASNLASALMMVQLFGGAFVIALSVSFSSIFHYLFFIGLLLMLTSPWYVIISVERQWRRQRK